MRRPNRALGKHIIRKAVSGLALAASIYYAAGQAIDPHFPGPSDTLGYGDHVPITVSGGSNSAIYRDGPIRYVIEEQWPSSEGLYRVSDYDD